MFTIFIYLLLFAPCRRNEAALFWTITNTCLFIYWKPPMIGAQSVLLSALRTMRLRVRAWNANLYQKLSTRRDLNEKCDFKEKFTRKGWTGKKANGLKASWAEKLQLQNFSCNDGVFSLCWPCLPDYNRCIYKCDILRSFSEKQWTEGE